MNRRRTGGRESWVRLKEWDKGQADAERLASHLLALEGYTSIEPSHPLGGPDGIKDIVCEGKNKRWIVGVFFPRGKKTGPEIRKKFDHDRESVKVNDADGFVFVTNQELTLKARDELKKRVKNADCEILHLERIARLLDSPRGYGIRLEFLDIEMEKEEQLSFIAERDRAFSALLSQVGEIRKLFERNGILDDLSSWSLQSSIPLQELERFKEILDSIAGPSAPFTVYVGGYAPSGHISDLQVPLDELKEFAELLHKITGSTNLLAGTSLVTVSDYGLGKTGTVGDLHVPLDALKEYETTLDRILEKQQTVLFQQMSLSSDDDTTSS